MTNTFSNSLFTNSRETINPYRSSINEIYQRLKWDLNWKSLGSKQRLKNLKNSHQGEKAVIICNGPSLLKTDFSSLSGIYTFGLNKINLLFDKKDFRPSCVTAVNDLVIQQNADFFNSTNIPVFIDSTQANIIRNRKNVTFLHSSKQSKFARDCSVSIQQGFTVTFVAMQLAFHMGFKAVALIGCDHNFTTKGPANVTVNSKDNDPDHFDPNYFSGGQKWMLPDLVASEYYYTMARDIYEANGRKITNCTSGGKLEVFERDSLCDWVKTKR